MAKQLMDDEDSLKRRARRRLIGAVTLTAVIVVVLPLVLDSEQKPMGQDIELRIPDRDKVAEFEPKIPLPSAPVMASAASAVAVVSAPPVDATSAPASPVAAVSKPVQAKPAAPEHKMAAKTAEAVHTEQKQPGFVVQIGAFASAESAHQLQKKLSKQGIKVYTEKVDNKTRVRAGPYATREAADKEIGRAHV